MTTLAIVLAAGTARGERGPREAEAAERFDRGIRLFNENDNAAALAEFERAYAVIPSPIVLFNMGLVQAAMRRSVDAATTLSRVVGESGALSPTQLARARTVLEEQRARIGEIAVTTTAPGITVELDGAVLGTTPLPGPLRVASGEHVIVAHGINFAPARRSVSVAGRARTDVAFDMKPIEGRPAQIVVRVNVPGADVLVDGELAGKTPLPLSLAVAPGKRQVAIRRPGYRTVEREIQVGEGAAGELVATLEEDGTGAKSTLGLAISEAASQITVDGVPRGGLTRIALPIGLHRLRVERDGFLPLERDIELGSTFETVRVTLDPTAKYRAESVGTATRQRTWGIVATTAGGALLGGSIGFLVYNAGQIRKRRSEFDATYENNRRGAGGTCDQAGTLEAGARATCDTQVDVAAAAYDSAIARNVVGYVGIGVSAAILGTGIVLLATGDPPGRYDPAPRHDTLVLRLDPMLGGTSGVAMSGRF